MRWLSVTSIPKADLPNGRGVLSSYGSLPRGDPESANSGGPGGLLVADGTVFDDVSWGISVAVLAPAGRVSGFGSKASRGGHLEGHIFQREWTTAKFAVNELDGS